MLTRRKFFIIKSYNLNIQFYTKRLFYFIKYYYYCCCYYFMENIIINKIQKKKTKLNYKLFKFFLQHTF